MEEEREGRKRWECMHRMGGVVTGRMGKGAAGAWWGRGQVSKVRAEIGDYI